PSLPRSERGEPLRQFRCPDHIPAPLPLRPKRWRPSPRPKQLMQLARIIGVHAGNRRSRPMAARAKRRKPGMHASSAPPISQIIGLPTLAPRLCAIASLDPAARWLEEVLRRLRQPFELALMTLHHYQ